jgi:hypothetical protein
MQLSHSTVHVTLILFILLLRGPTDAVTCYIFKVLHTIVMVYAKTHHVHASQKDIWPKFVCMCKFIEWRLETRTVFFSFLMMCELGVDSCILQCLLRFGKEVGIDFLLKIAMHKVNSFGIQNFRAVWEEMFN